MTPEERRRDIIEATLPLLLEQGPELSTREIAQAAGVAEGTIFRAFETKSDLIHATIHAALRPDAAIARLAGLPATQSLTERVAAVLEVLGDELHRTRSLFAHFARGQDGPPVPPAGDHHRRPWPNRGDNKSLMMSAVSDALEPYAHVLAVPVPVAARVLAAVSFAGLAITDGETPSPPGELADVVLHGIAKGDS